MTETFTGDFTAGEILESTDGTVYDQIKELRPSNEINKEENVRKGPSLAEQLQAQRDADEEEYKQRHRNRPPKGLDEEDIAFLQDIEKEEKERQLLKKKQIEEDINEFNRAVRNRVINHLNNENEEDNNQSDSNINELTFTEKIPSSKPTSTTTTSTSNQHLSSLIIAPSVTDKKSDHLLDVGIILKKKKKNTNKNKNNNNNNNKKKDKKEKQEKIEKSIKIEKEEKKEKNPTKIEKNKEINSSLGHSHGHSYKNEEKKPQSKTINTSSSSEEYKPRTVIETTSSQDIKTGTKRKIRDFNERDQKESAHTQTLGETLPKSSTKKIKKEKEEEEEEEEGINLPNERPAKRPKFDPSEWEVDSA